MVTGELLITIILSLLLFLLGFGAIIRSSQDPLNRRFFLFSVTISSWLVSNYVSATTTVSHDLSLIANRVVLVAGGASTLAILGFMLQLAEWHKKRRWRLLLVINVATWVLCLTTLVVSDITFKDNQVVNTFGPFAFVYFLILILTALSVLYVMVLGNIKLEGIKKLQFKIISKSVLMVVPIILIGNAVLPVFGYYFMVNITPLFTGLIVVAMFYVIRRHKLFDLRLVIVRSMAYFIALAIIAGLYGAIIHYVSVLLSTDNNQAAWNEAVSITLIVVAITTYGPLKKGLDRATNRIFFRDSYDPQTVLNDLNTITTSTIDLSPLARGTLRLLETTMKSSYCDLVLVNKESDNRVFSSTMIPNHNLAANTRIEKYLAPHSPILVSDAENDDQLVKSMRLLNLEVAMPMYANKVRIGYLALGTKHNGAAYSHQDIQLLLIAADSMAVAVQNALRFEEIELFNATLQAKINDATRKLQKTNEKLKALDETKDDFISMASHQLRTPLTSVKGYISMVLEGDAGNITPVQKDMLGQAFFSSQRMVYLIADLLNVSRLKTGKFIIEPAAVNLSTVIEEELGQLKETAAARQLKLQYVKPKKFPDLMLDETKIRQVIMNFVDNAIYYTPAGGTIKVKLIDEKNTVELRVEDSGIGVPKSEQPHLFTKFYRAGNARKARPDGTGLGLFMAKKVIAAQGGSTLFESHEGKGSTFGFIFNKAHLDSIAKAAAKSKNLTTTSTTRTQNQLTKKL